MCNTTAAVVAKMVFAVTGARAQGPSPFLRDPDRRNKGSTHCGMNLGSFVEGCLTWAPCFVAWSGFMRARGYLEARKYGRKKAVTVLPCPTLAGQQCVKIVQSDITSNDGYAADYGDTAKGRQ